MSTEVITNLSLGFLCVWTAVCVLGALFMARETRWNPLPPEEPEHHDHH